MMRAIIDSLRGSLQEPLTCAQYEAVLHDLIGSLSLDDQVIFAPDPRIAQALVIIQDLPDKKIAAQELAALVFLSKGRFEHLFKAEIGVPLRSYLLWQRLCTAIARSWQGRTFTAAAHEAGFTDSAHLSRTCRQMFGISPSDVILRQGEAQIIVCGNEIQPMSDDDT